MLNLPKSDNPELNALQLRLTRLAQSAPEVTEVDLQSQNNSLLALLELGDAPVDLVIAHRGQIRAILDVDSSRSPFEGLDELLATDLAAFKHVAWLRILLRDRLEMTPLEEMMTDLTQLADAITGKAYLDTTGGAPAPVMLALGKWGGQELNVASDIDPVFFAPGELAGEAGDKIVRGWLAKLARRPGAELYQIDLRLRPEGVQGPLIAPFSELERYFFQRAAPWERIAWLRVRPVMGEMPKWIRQILDAFLFGTGDDPRNRVTEVARSLLAVRRTAKPRDVKRVPGGIRDVEFLVASLQLSLGRSLPVLRGGTVLELLSIAAEENVLRAPDAEALASGYRFARSLEHALQARHGAARFIVPEPGHPEHTVLAHSFDMTPDELESHWARHRATVASIVAKHLPMDTGIHESALLAVDPQGDDLKPRFSDDRSNSILRRLGEGRINLRELYDPQLIVGHPHEAEVLLRLESSVRAFGGTTSWRQAFGRKRDLRTEMTRLLLFGQRVVEEAIKRPYLFERIGLKKYAPDGPVEGDAKELTQRLGDMLFHLGERFIASDVDATRFTSRWSHSVDEVIAHFAEEYLTHAPCPTAIIGVGKWGGNELAPDADLDMLFVCEDGSAEDVAASIKRGTDFLGKASLGGTLLLDPRLRPEGASAPMVITLSRLQDYLSSGRAQPWEKLALIRARQIGGDAEVGKRAIELLQEFATAPADSEELREIDRARRKASQAQRALGNTARIKKALGGMMDFEFVATVAVWSIQNTIGPEWWSQPVASRLRDLAVWTDDSRYDEAADAYLELRRWELVQWASGLGKRGLVALEGEDADLFATAAGLTVEELVSRWQRVSTLGQNLYLPLFPS